MTAPRAIPSPLGLTADAFVRAAGAPLANASGSVNPSKPLARPAALALYKSFFRDGVNTRWPMPLIARTLREESPEGEVIKFISRVPANPFNADSPALRALESSVAELEIESVLIPMMGSNQKPHHTLCVSSQVGCAMGCTFCETAQMGLIRSLSAAEIVSQWWNAAHIVGIRPRNIVFMGMGEPLDNLDAVIQAIDVLRDHNGPHVAMSQITVSTVGRVDGIRLLSEKVREPGWHRLALALSLNAPNDADRSSIMPINRKWNLAAVREALLEWPRATGNKVCIEYVMIPGVNDSLRHAEEIAEFMAPFGLLDGPRIAGSSIMAVLNLIPYNPRRNSPWPAPSEARVEEFLGWLRLRGVFAKRRRTKGRAMMGACGQLGNEHIRRRALILPTISA